MMQIKSTLVFREVFNVTKNILSSSRYFPVVTTAHINNVNYFSTKSVEEKIGLPARPKKPLTPYFRFMKEMRPKVLSENPNASITEITKIIANKWKIADENSKKRLEDEYKKEQVLYVENRAKYDSKLTDSQRNEIKQMKQELIEAKERRAYRKRVKELGKPKRPPSAFLKFIQQERTLSPPSGNMSYREWLKKTAEKWTRMSDEEKDKLKNATIKELEKYRQDVSKWENKMIRLGNIDVVRQDSLIDSEVTSKSKKKTA